MKWIAPILVYLAVGLGILQFHSAWGALIGFHAAIIVSLLIARPDLPIKTLFKNTKFKWILFSVLLCSGSGVALYFLWNYFGFASDFSVQIESFGLNRSTWISFIAYFALINPWLEEYLWRGYLGSNSTNLHISDFLYAGFHGLVLLNMVQAGSIIFGLAVLTFAGWFWRQLFREDKGLLTPVLGHMAADLGILIAVYLKV